MTDNMIKRVLHAIRKPSTQEIRKDNPEKMVRDTAVTYALSNFLHGSFEKMYNPDKLVRIKGAKIYNKMLVDDQVQAAFNLKLNIIISRKMRFEPTGEGQEEIIDFFDRNINDLISGTWLGALRGILMGKAYGFSISEKIFRSEEVDGKLRWVIDKINPKPYDSFLFDTDKYGNLLKIRQDVDQTGVGKVLNPDKFIRYINKPEIDPIWGQSDLKPAYRPYWEKDITGKYWNIYLERMAGGFVTVTPNERAGNLSPGDRTDLENALKNLTGLSGMIMPQGYDAEMHISKETKAFIDRVAQADKQIARAILIPNLLGFSEQGGVGSYSQSQTQLDVFMMLIKEDGDYLADVLNEQLFSQLAWWNFGVKDYPRAVFEEFTTEQKRLIAELWIKAQKDGAVTNTIDDELRTRELLLYPVPDKEELEKEIEERKALLPTIPPKDDKPTKDDDSKTADTPTTGTKKDDSKTTQQSESGLVQINLQPGNACSHDNTEHSPKVLDVVNHQEETKVNFMDRINFTNTKDRLDDIEYNFVSNMSKGVDSGFSELIISMGIVNKKAQNNRENYTSEKITKDLEDSISSKTKAMLHKGIRSNLKATYNLGWNTSHKATEKAARQNKAPEKFIKRIQSVVLLSERRMCSLKEWTFAHFVEGISLEVADAWFSSQAFTITGDLTQDMIDSAVKVMTEGIRDEWSLTQMTTELKNVLGNITGGTKRQERNRLNTIVRTNMSTIFTQAQLAFYNDPGLNGFVEALQYSAVMDNRTTPICQRLDQSTYAINNPIWRFITPPNHFQCRSVLIPATVLDKWNEDKKGFSEKQLPGKGFGQSGLAQMFDISLSK